MTKIPAKYYTFCYIQKFSEIKICNEKKYIIKKLS